METLAPVPVAGLSIWTSTTSPSIISVSSRILTPMLFRNAWGKKWPIWNRSKNCSAPELKPLFYSFPGKISLSLPSQWKGCLCPGPALLQRSFERCDCQVRLFELNKSLWGCNLCNTHGNCSFSCAGCSSYQDSASGNFSWGNPPCYDFFFQFMWSLGRCPIY